MTDPMNPNPAQPAAPASRPSEAEISADLMELQKRTKLPVPVVRKLLERRRIQVMKNTKLSVGEYRQRLQRKGDDASKAILESIENLPDRMMVVVPQAAVS